MQWSTTLGLPDLRAELSAVRMDIYNPYPNIIDPSKPTLTWRTSTVRAAPRSRLGVWGRASWSHPPPLGIGASQQFKPSPLHPVGLFGRCTGSLWPTLLS